MFVSNNLDINEKGNLTISGMDTTELAAEYGTPLYVMDEAVIRDNCRRFKSSIDKYYGGQGRVCYASKAFSCMEMCSMMKQMGKSVNRLFVSFYPIYFYIIYVFTRYIVPYQYSILIQLATLVVYFFIILIVEALKKKETPFNNSLNSILSCLYPGVLISLFVYINHIDYFVGVKYLSTPLIVTFIEPSVLVLDKVLDATITSINNSICCFEKNTPVALLVVQNLVDGILGDEDFVLFSDMEDEEKIKLKLWMLQYFATNRFTGSNVLSEDMFMRKKNNRDDFFIDELGEGNPVRMDKGKNFATGYYYENDYCDNDYFDNDFCDN